MIRVLSSVSFVLILGLTWLHHPTKTGVLGEMEIDDLSMEQAEMLLGASEYSHHIELVDEEKAEWGRQLIYTGQAKKGVFKSKLISPYFVCTDCHNVGKEYDLLTDNSPEQRLDYAIKNDLPFLPASSFYGIYNRKSFYNGDYSKKYGEVIAKAKNSLPEAVQVCAKYCSAGRFLEDWEVEAILHFYKKNELKIKDLPLSGNTKKNLKKYSQLDKNETDNLLALLDQSMVRGYPATFLETKPRDERRYGENGNVEEGKEIYNRACLHCHLNGRVTHLKLDDNQLSGEMFVKNKTNYTDLSLYQIVRHGTYTMAGRYQYMPLYTEEKMSSIQVESLMAYLETLAKD